MNEIKINGKNHAILWDYGVIFDTAQDLKIDYIEDVYEILINWSNDKGKMKISTLQSMAVLVKNMVLAADKTAKIDIRDVLNSFLSSPENQTIIVDEIESKTPKAESNSYPLIQVQFPVFDLRCNLCFFFG